MSIKRRNRSAGKKPPAVTTERDLLALDRSLAASQNGANPLLGSDIHNLGEPLLQYLASARDPVAETADDPLKDYLTEKTRGDPTTAERRRPAVERFRYWYEVNRKKSSTYSALIEPLTNQRKLLALHIFTALWLELHDLRHLNFCLKLIDDIHRECRTPTDGQFTSMYARYVKHAVAGVRKLHEQLEVS